MSVDLPLKDYKPQSKLVTAVTEIRHPRFSVIDAHNHLGETFGGGWVNRPIRELLDVMDEAGVELLVDLDGGWGEDVLHHHLDHFKAHSPARFIHFGGIDWSQWESEGNRFAEWAASRLRVQKERGTQGLKVWKNLGLRIHDHQGQLVKVDDMRLAPIWETAGELGLPVLIHVADPVAFFDPLDPTNERWEELHANPDWHFPSPPFPAFMEIMNQLAALVKRHPRTIFIGAHVGCYAENLAWVGKLLDQAPNFYVDISARIAELGRQPYTARRFFIDYADRILFGMDLAAETALYRLHYRFLETDDEYFDYSFEEVPPSGRWKIYGLNLPDPVLEKVYALNARKVLNIE
jgi:predicted TIM-barrel fold metal-dependent hydrolase